MVLIIDNYDSFTYNLAQLSAAVHEDIRVIRNDEMTVDEVVELSPSYVIISSVPAFRKRRNMQGTCNADKGKGSGTWHKPWAYGNL